MEKKIVITVTEDESGYSHGFKSEGMTHFEVMGLLRFYEKKLWLDILNKTESTPLPPQSKLSPSDSEATS